MDSNPILFGGDFFGSYPSSFFEDTIVCDKSTHPDPSPSDSDSSNDEDFSRNSTVWEPAPASLPTSSASPEGQLFDGPSVPASSHCNTVEEQLNRRKTFIVRYPSSSVGAPIPDAELHSSLVCGSHMYQGYHSNLAPGQATNLYAPFTSRLDWELAKWAKLRGIGSTAFSDLLRIEEVAERLALSYKTSRELNDIIDKKLPTSRPRFQRHEIVVAGEAFEVYFRDILECIEALYGDPEFAPMLLLVPERHYADGDRTVRVYFDMNTGKWWWATQKQLEERRPGATVIPIIISSDKTQLTVFGNKTAYPVYMTIGNLPKDVRCKPSRGGQILLAYLPTSRLLHITNKAACRRTLANLFHACMSRVLAPVASVGVDGMPLASGDGVVRRGHPIVATYVGDYPEQVLVSGCKTGECPKCPIPRNEVGQECNTSRPLRDLGTILDALSAIDDGPRAFAQACREAGIKPIYEPFWANLPYTHIFTAITPDILHQLYQGVVKHLVAWLQEAYGENEIDARCRRLPPNHNLRHFGKGISTLSCVTGKEHQDICRILLGLMVGRRLPGGASPVRLVRATRALLDFLYLAQYPTHTTDTLHLLDDALEAFHANKGIFVDLGIRQHFQLPKLHSLDHYRRSIELFGTTDNYDTQYSERLHIDLAKDAYRATNHKDELDQMTKWLIRKEKIQRHAKYIEWRLRQDHEVSQTPLTRPTPGTLITRHPSVKAVKLADVSALYGATFFRDALARFAVSLDQPHLTPAEVEYTSGSIYLNFSTILVYHRVKFSVHDPHAYSSSDAISRDAIHVRPTRKNKHGIDVPGRFDTALVCIGPGSKDSPGAPTIGVHRFRVAQVRLVFTLPDKALPMLFPRLSPSARPHHLAYVEWFTPFTTPHVEHGLYRITRSTRNHARLASILPVEQLERSCHLYPDFGPIAPRHWTSATVLDDCPAFFVNSFLDRNTYKLLY
ncbi:hypothetical protein C8Q74DRAFT_1212299 [Fomes fomentarius]|nr:hypothetical protein C8Q74DRAFT_1212299 [Fomes fomentarius]